MTTIEIGNIGSKVIEKHHFKYKSGQQYTINGNTMREPVRFTGPGVVGNNLKAPGHILKQKI